MDKFNNIVFTEPQFNDQPSAWIEHIPFAFFLIEKLRPKTFVELGTQFGNSYFAFCQAISELKLPSKAFGVDIWLSNDEGSLTGCRIFEYANRVNSEHFSHFSNLLMMTFDEALEYFNDREIDLLHIDGMHDYASVKHDFETWLPKMSDAGVIIFHDSNVRENGFGVWKLIEEIAGRYPNFSFNFGHGLTVVCTGKSVPHDFLDFVKAADDDAFTHQLFYALGSRLLLKNGFEQQSQHFQKTTNDLKSQIKHLEWELKKKVTEIENLKTMPAQPVTPQPVLMNHLPEPRNLSFVQRLRLKISSAKAIREIIKSGLFDQKYYLQNNPDVKASGMNPARHYLLYGGFEGRKPSEKFDSAFYLEQNPDVKVSGMNPLVHYLRFGSSENRKPSKRRG
jgi:hypothetical protein